DTFGNVVLEALAAGVPAIVTADGGPKFIVEHEKSGFVVKNDGEFIDYVDKLRRDPDLLTKMRLAARQHSEQAPSWHSVFASVYDTYETAVLGSADRHPSTESLEELSAAPFRTNADAQLG